MKFLILIQKAWRIYISFTIDKVINTLIWLFTPKDKVIVLNVWLWHRGKKVRSHNLGDDLNYAVVSYLSKKRIVNYKYSYISLFKPRNYMCIGSITDYLTNEESIIWGSGFLRGNKNNPIKKPKEVLAVRGPLTREYLLSQGISCPEIYGDPVLLLPMVYPIKEKVKKYKIGLIPHYKDYELENVRQFKKTFGDDVLIISMEFYEKWQDVIDQINECELIASSSLHGLIISDAYGIPNAWVKLSDNNSGKDMKFPDYFQSCGRKQLNAIDFTEKAIDYDIIKQESLKYSFSNVNIDKLLEVCPFYQK